MESYTNIKIPQRKIHDIHQRQDNHIITVIQVEQKRWRNNPLIQSINMDEFYINFSRNNHIISENMTRAWIHEFQSSNTIFQIRGRNKMECYTKGNTNHIKEKAQIVISKTHESLTNSHAFILRFQKQICSPANIFQPMGSNPHLIKRYKFIDKNNKSAPQ